MTDPLDEFDDLAEFDEDFISPVDDTEPEEDDLSDWDEPEDEVVEEVPPAKPSKPEPVEALGSRSSVKASALIASPATKTSEALRRPLISGHCAFPQSKDPEESHKRCRGYSRANPDKIFQPCPCSCHFPEEEYECGNCGATIKAAPHWPADEDGDTRYVHVDQTTDRAVSEECPR